jgi:uridine monophosphate synthetase
MSQQADLVPLILALYEIGAVQLGRFRLHSGLTSPIYLDLRLLVSFPQVMRQASAAYRTVLGKLKFDILAATPLAGLPIGTALCLDMDIPLIYPRKSGKSYGTGKSIEGKWQVGQKAIVVDDLVTSGDSIMQAIIPLKAAGLQVRDAVVLIDREQGGVAALKEQGYHLHTVMSIRYLLAVLEEEGRITAKQHTRILNTLD